MDPKDQKTPEQPIKTEHINVQDKTLNPKQQEVLHRSNKRRAVSQQKRAAQDAHASRVRQTATQQGGSVPGGLQESAAAMADPNYLERSRQATQQRREESAQARQDAGVRNPHRPATDSTLGAFRSAASGNRTAIGANPNIAARAERFKK